MKFICRFRINFFKHGMKDILAVRLLSYISELLADFVVCLAFS